MAVGEGKRVMTVNNFLIHLMSTFSSSHNAKRVRTPTFSSNHIDA